MLLILFASLLLNIVSSFEPNLQLDAQGILDLDEAMYQDVTKPNKIKKNVIMNNMMNLFLSLDHIYEQLREEGENADGFKKVVADLKAKGLKIVDLKQKDADVMKAYDWDEDRATQLRRNLERASEMWRNILEEVEKPHPAATAV